MKVLDFELEGRIREEWARSGLGVRLWAVAIAAAVVAAHWALFMRGHRAVYDLQGAPEPVFDALAAAPDGWSAALAADFVFIGLVALLVSVLVSAASAAPLGDAAATTVDPRRRLRTAIAGSTIIFVVADVVETWQLYQLLQRVDSGRALRASTWAFELGSALEVVKWGAIAVTGVLVVRLWTTSLPRTGTHHGPINHRCLRAPDTTIRLAGDDGSGPSVLDYLRDAVRRPIAALLPRRQATGIEPATSTAAAPASATVTIEWAKSDDRSATIEWGKPDDRPPTDPSHWDPKDGRLGIAVSGGGIRSASLALGAMQQLREQDVLRKARYVTSVSGGSYMTSGLTAVNQAGEGEQPVDDAYAPTAAETQRLRRSLRYLFENASTGSSAIMRIVLGILINFAVVYALLFLALRPVGWAIGTTFAHDELRVTEAVAVSVDSPPAAACGATNRTGCRIGTRQLAAGPAGAVVQIFPVHLETVELTVTLRTSQGDEFDVLVAVEPVADAEGRITIVDGTATVTRQPRVALADGIAATVMPSPDADLTTDERDRARAAAEAVRAKLLGDANASWERHEITPADIVRVRAPAISVTGDATGFGDDVTPSELAPFVTIDRSPGIGPIGLLERRGDLDIDDRHWLPAVVFLIAAAVLATYRTLIRPDNHRVVGRLGVGAAGLAAAWFLFFVAVPWLLVEIPARFVVADAGPSDDLLGSLDWFPGDPGGLPPLLAWLFLAGTAVSRFKGERAAKPAAAAPQKRNMAALIGKVMRRVQQAAVALALAFLVAGGALVVLAGATLNGPAGGHTYLARLFLENDAIVWFVVAAVLVGLSTAGESYGWSPGPHYKRQLSVAFHQRRDGGSADRRSYRTGTWTQFAPDPQAAAVGDERLGYLDGEHGDGTELVLCTAANVRGFGNTPAGRDAVSFTVSRSWTGGPEIGWLDTATYVDRMGRRRRWDINLPGITALSGAAVSTSMGKKGFGPIGSFLALLNVRLGAWIPHPQHVNAMAPGETWDHNPGWPWYVREVVRRHERDAPYLYVSDGGHWENFAIVEALRRGCTTIICIAAAGDGVYSLNTLGEAVEIARTDLGVEILLDDAWKVRPRLADTPTDPLPSGRQYILDPGPSAELGQAADVAFAFGTFTYPDGTEGEILLLDAAMIDKLPVDVHSYAENHPEFPDVSTGDQFFSDRDFESYRVLGRELVTRAFDTPEGRQLAYRISNCSRTEP